MKNFRFLFLAILIFSITFHISCNKHKDVLNNNQKGKITLSLQVNPSSNLTNLRTTSVNTDSFKVILYSAAGNVELAYELYKNVPEEVELDTGSYYIVANSNNLKAAAI